MKNHVNKKYHELVKKKIYVNSFHNFGLNEKFWAKTYHAFSKDGNIECFIHKI